MTDLDPTERAEVTVGGMRNWEKFVGLTVARKGDQRASAEMADALAALLDECTPAHREVTAGQFAITGAQGRVREWPLPPGLPRDAQLCTKWAAVVLLDCIDKISHQHARSHSVEERATWRARAQRYTQGAETLAVRLPR